MPEFLFDEDATQQQFIRPDEDGFTLRTRYKGTQAVLDQNAASRALLPKDFKNSDGSRPELVGRIPMEVYEQWFIKLGFRHPTKEELLAFLDDRDYSKLKTRDVRLT